MRELCTHHDMLHHITNQLTVGDVQHEQITVCGAVVNILQVKTQLSLLQQQQEEQNTKRKWSISTQRNQKNTNEANVFSYRE